jgi:hypothetical protein
MLLWELNRIIDQIGSSMFELSKEYMYDLPTLAEHVDFGMGAKDFLAMVISERTQSLNRRGRKKVGHRNLFFEILPKLPEGNKVLQALMEFNESFASCIKKQSEGYAQLYNEARSAGKGVKARMKKGLDPKFSRKIRNVMRPRERSKVKKTLMELRRKLMRSRELVMSDWNSDLKQIRSIKTCKPLVIRELRSA